MYSVQSRSVVYVRLILFPSRSELAAVFVDLLRSCRRRARYTVRRTSRKCIFSCLFHRTSSISIISYGVTRYYIIELDRLNAYVNKTTRLKYSTSDVGLNDCPATGNMIGEPSSFPTIPLLYRYCNADLFIGIVFTGFYEPCKASKFLFLSW